MIQVFLVSTLLFFHDVNAFLSVFSEKVESPSVADTFECGGSDVIVAIAFKSGSYLNRIGFRCTNGDWSDWYGTSSGGAYNHVYAKGSGFCGVSGRTGNPLGIFGTGKVVDRICVTDAGDTETHCFGGMGGTSFT